MVRKLMTFQLLTALLASGASIPTIISSTPVISNSTAAVNQISNSSLTDKPSCMIPRGKYVDISIQACQPALNQLMQQPDTSTLIEYRWSGLPIPITKAPCIISLECAGPSSDITISPGQIAGDAYWIIMKCELAEAGWMHVDGSRGWFVTVKGAAEGNATTGETGNTSLLEDQGEQYLELTESS